MEEPLAKGSLEYFTTHAGERVNGARLTRALHEVAEDWADLAHSIYREDAYADHVTEDEKLTARDAMLAQAEQIRIGRFSSMTIAQRVNTALTGVCVGILGASPAQSQGSAAAGPHSSSLSTGL